jgi:anthranilate synthase component 1
MITEIVLIFDHARQTLRVCSNSKVSDNPEEDYKCAIKKIEETIELLSQPLSLQPAPLGKIGLSSGKPPVGNFSQEEFKQLVEKTKGYIKDGDIIQAVLSQRFSIPYNGTPINLYRAIRAINPSPYMFILETNDYSIVGASPEVHVRLNDENVLIRPIAGTRPRGKTEKEDQEFEQDLLNDEKEKAEHLMLVDLARNDIGRVCQHGSVKAVDFMCIEKYSHVMHIVSQVIGKLSKEKNAFDLMRATFPAGTVSGAPKIRAMQIISEFEKTCRSAYAGALGYFGFEGNHDSCIAIRTAILKDNKIHLQAGAGIVADSEPEMEFLETINKAKGMLSAAELAKNMSTNT